MILKSSAEVCKISLWNTLLRNHSPNGKKKTINFFLCKQWKHQKENYFQVTNSSFLCEKRKKKNRTNTEVKILSLLPGGTVIKNPHANAGDARDMVSIPGSGRCHGVGNDNPLHYSCLENSMGRGAWWDSPYNPWGHKESDMTEQLSMKHIHGYLQ